MLPEARSTPVSANCRPRKPQAGAHDAQELRAGRDDRRVVRHEEGDDGAREQEDQQAEAPPGSTKPSRPPSRPIARRALDVAGADVLADQGRDRHRQAHRRDHDRPAATLRADAVGGERQGAEAGDQEGHHHQRRAARADISIEAGKPRKKARFT